MSDLMLNLSIFPVGPRESWDAPRNDEWVFALQVAPSFRGEPANRAEAEEWAAAMLPWRVLGTSSATEIAVAWRMFREDESFVGGTARARSIGKLDPLDIRGSLETAFPRFAGKPQPARSFEGPSTGRITEIDERTMLLPAVLQAFGGSTPQLTSGELHCTWYFAIRATGNLIEEVTSRGRRLAAFPLAFFDTRGGQSIRFEPGGDGPPFTFENGAVCIRYRAAQMNEGALLAQTLPFPMDRLKDPMEPVLGSYWLPATDSRMDSVAEIHAVVSNGLKLRARAHFLTPEVLVSSGVVQEGAVDPAADARLFVDAARRLFDIDEDDQALRERRDRRATELIAEALQAAKAPNKMFLGELRSQLVNTIKAWWVEEGRAAINAHAKLQLSRGDEAALFAGFGLYILSERTDVRPVLPGEGIDVLLGDPALRLRSDTDADTGNDSDHAHIAELGVLVRRAGTAAELRSRRWFLATSAVVALDQGRELQALDRYWGSEIAPPDVTDEEIAYHHEPVVRGIKSSFQNGLCRTDFTYHGLPLIAENIGSALHDIPGEADENMPDFFDELLPLSHQPLGPVATNVAHSDSTFVPPLRYGDFYQFAGFVIDRGGGIPSELVPAASEPLSARIDWGQLEAGQIPLLDTNPPIEFLRRVPVGEVNILPPPSPMPGKKPQWSPLPAGVILRSREWLASLPATTDVDNVPALLLSDGDAFTRKVPSYGFRVIAPVLDEHTLSRWLMPAAVDPADTAQIEAAARQRDATSEAVAEIHRRRATLLQRRAALRPAAVEWDGEDDVLPADPAVTKIGLRCHFIDRHGVETRSLSFLESSADVVVAIGDTPSLVNPITLPAGTFAVLEFLPLVRMDDFERFESLAMIELTEEEPWIDDAGVQYKAFRESRIVVESASADLPNAGALYDAFKLSALSGGAIDVSLKPDNGLPLEEMAFVDRYEVARQRWTWRNRPIVIPGGGLQSQLPKELVNNDATRDAARPVLQYDALADLDRGLVDRGRVGGRVPRLNDGSPMASTQLLADDRDAVSHADYLRYGVSLISRYAGILDPNKARVTARGADHTDRALRALEPIRSWRRITAPFRGDATRLKAPKTLAILPLTRGVVHEQITGVSADATPVLIVLDEIWFREYGWCEELNVEIVLETKEIGNLDLEARPFRVGPLPDHYVNAHFDKPPFNGRRHFYDDSTDDMQNRDDSQRHTFKVFGPFGHSLDRSGNEALANATAFIAYAPAEVKSHYAAFVRLRRVLRGKEVQEGPPGGTYAIYTQPDVAQLALDSAEVRISGDAFRSTGLTLRPTAEEPAPDVAKQYRYLLLLGPVFHDFGRGNDLFLPSHAAWLHPENGQVAWPSAVPADLPQRGAYRGRVLELLLNGRFAAGDSPIEKPDSLHEILARLFVDNGNPEDAAAMIRRISPSFSVAIG